jgi:hypothetical protein
VDQLQASASRSCLQALDQRVHPPFVFLLEQGRVEVGEHIHQHDHEAEEEVVLDGLEHGKDDDKKEGDEVADFGACHLMAQVDQLSEVGPRVDLDLGVQESKDGVLDHPPAEVDADCSVEPGMGEEVQVGEVAGVEGCATQQDIADDAYGPRDGADGEAEGQVFEKHRVLGQAGIFAGEIGNKDRCFGGDWLAMEARPTVIQSRSETEARPTVIQSGHK